MILRGARIALNAKHAERLDIQIRGWRIVSLGDIDGSRTDVDLSNCLVLPGLINSHDHLEFNLFPRMDTGGPHPNYIEWAELVFHPGRPPIADHLQVPKPARLQWGGIKNLLSGATTVAHHNRYEPAVFDEGFPVRVVKRYGWAHSVHFAPEYYKIFRRTPRKWPFIIHAGEGTDALAEREIIELERARVLSGRTVIVHAVAAGQSTIPLLRETGTGLVWCPSSNLFTLGATLQCCLLRSGISIALGTDSALTGEGDLIDEIGVARQQGHVTAEEIYDMVTRVAAKLLNLADGSGFVRQGGRADLVVISDIGQTPGVSIQGMCPKMVIAAGKLALVAVDFANRVSPKLTKQLQRIWLEDRGEFLIAADLSQLVQATAPYLGPEFKLAGRRLRA